MDFRRLNMRRLGTCIPARRFWTMHGRMRCARKSYWPNADRYGFQMLHGGGIGLRRMKL